MGCAVKTGPEQQTCALGCGSKPFTPGPCTGKQVLDIAAAKDATTAVMGMMATAKDCAMCFIPCGSATTDAAKQSCALGCTAPKAAATTAKAGR
jgi:hypothetical protein